MMGKYKLRDDVVIESIAGRSYLLSMRSAWDEVDFVRFIPSLHVQMIGFLEQGLDDQTMLEQVSRGSLMTDERLVRLYHNIAEGKMYENYLVEVQEEKR